MRAKARKVKSVYAKVDPEVAPKTRISKVRKSRKPSMKTKVKL